MVRDVVMTGWGRSREDAKSDAIQYILEKLANYGENWTCVETNGVWQYDEHDGTQVWVFKFDCLLGE